MGTRSGERLRWSIEPRQLLWKLTDRARQYKNNRILTPTAALGKRGEDLAHRYLQRAGFQVVARNFKPGEDSEVDIVAKRGDLTIFVEVKTRTTDEHSAPDRAIDSEKERHIIRAARAFATRAGIEWNKVRFDIVSVVMRNPPAITHVEDAFFGGRSF
jgi:putative endonuclease